MVPEKKQDHLVSTEGSGRASQSIADHILPASSNLLGICFVIFSYIKVNARDASTRLDEFLILPMSLFFLASLFSYLSLRSPSRSQKLESIADWLFMIGLLSLSVLSFIFVLEVVM